MSAHAVHLIHPNSRAANDDGREGAFSKREEEILDALGRLRRATDREIMLACGRSEMNEVRPRISEMVEADVLQEVGRLKDPITGKMVRIVEVRPKRNAFPCFNVEQIALGLE